MHIVVEHVHAPQALALALAALAALAMDSRMDFQLVRFLLWVMMVRIMNLVGVVWSALGFLPHLMYHLMYTTISSGGEL